MTDAAASPAVPPSADLESQRCLHALALQKRIAAERDPARLSQNVMSEVSALMAAERATLFVFDRETMELKARFAEGMTAQSLVVPLRMGIVGSAIVRRELANVSNAYAHPYFNPEIDSAFNYKTDSLLVAPVVGGDGRLLGGLELLNKRRGRFSEEDEALLVKAAARLAKWIERDEVYPAGVEAEIAALRNATDCDRGTAFRLDPRTTRLVSLHADGDNGRPVSLSMKLGIAGMVAVTGEALVLEDAWADDRFDRSVDQRTGYRTRNMICLPLVSGSGETVGVIQVINKRDGSFTAGDRGLLEAIAAPVAIAIENAELFAEQERQFVGLIEAMVTSFEARDPRTAGHARRTVERTVALGRRLGVEPADIELLRIAALLHDYGMIMVPDAVLEKPGALDAGERDLMRQHTGLVESVLDSVRLSRRYRQLPLIAACHHEALDGSGYPRGLRGAEIPFLSRVLAVADSYEALVAERPYRAAMPSAAALGLIRADAGSRYDPVVVDALEAELAEASGPGDA